MNGRGLLHFAALPMLSGILLSPAVVQAQPEVQEETDTVQDATVTLRVRSAGIVDDPLLWCEVEIDVIGTEVPFVVGDTVVVEFIEDDLFVNDVLWTTMHTITQPEADAQAYSEVFDCSAPVMADGIGDLEFFAQAEVVKGMCGVGCLYDRPQTANLLTDGLEDDAFEDDDFASSAPNAVVGVPEERIARDEDWVRVTLQETGEIDADLQFMAACGAIDAILVDDDDQMLAEIEIGQDAGVVSATGLPPGVYFLQIQPADPGDFNFYDLTVDVTFTPDATTGGSSGDAGDGSAGSDTTPDSSSGTSNSSGSDSASSASDGSAGTAASSGQDTDDPQAGASTNDDGCGCSHRRSTMGWTWILLGLGLGLRRRRRP